MAQFDISKQIPGLDLSSLNSLPNNGTPTSGQIRFTAELFKNEANTPINVNANYNAASQILTITGQFTPTVKLFFDDLHICQIEIKVRVRDGTGGKKEFDTDKDDAVAITGSASWTGEAPKALGIPGDKINLKVGYNWNKDEGVGTFFLQLDGAIDIDRVFCKFLEGSISVNLLPADPPEKPALVLTLRGKVEAKEDGLNKFSSLLKSAFPSVPGLDGNRFDFMYTHRFEISSSGFPTVPIGLPRFTVSPIWSGLPPSLTTGDDLCVRVGLPTFSLDLPDIGSPLPDFELILRKCSIRFHKLDLLSGFDLESHLKFTTRKVNGVESKVFEVSPIASGTINLPEILQFLIKQFDWLRGQIWFLDELAELAEGFQEQFNWVSYISGCLPNDGNDLDDYFTDKFEPGFKGWMQLLNNAGYKWENCFDLFFQALDLLGSEVFDNLPNDFFDHVWKTWFELAGSATESLLTLLKLACASLNPGRLEILLRGLLGNSNVNLTQFLSGILDLGAEMFDSLLGQFTAIWGSLLAAAARTLDGEKLKAFVGALLDVMKTPNDSLKEMCSIGDIAPITIPDGFDLSGFRVRKVTLIVAIGLRGLMLRCSTPELIKLPSAFEYLDKMFKEANDRIARWMSQIPQIDLSPLIALFTAAVTKARDDDEAELILIELARIPILGQILALTLALVSLIQNINGKQIPFFHLMFQNVETDRNYSVKRFDDVPQAEPGEVKYLIFSDIHRDIGNPNNNTEYFRPGRSSHDNTDDRGEFEFGSIDHFNQNEDMYVKILKYAKAANYRVIEVGDCEELWFIRDFEKFRDEGGRKGMLESIIETHAPVYDILADLHKNKRYYRVIGNHDSYLRRPEVFDVLKNRMTTEGALDFKIYDYIIIDGVKTMTDHGFFDLLGDTILITDDPEERERSIIENILVGRLGLDSTPYCEKKPLLIAHGHQWDFWNCDQNNLIGNMIANGVGVPADMIMDPFADIEGIALGGSPVVDFEARLANLPVFSNFLSYQTALEFAHRIQHQSDKSRFPINDWFYLETFPAFITKFMMPLDLKIHDTGGHISTTTFQDSWNSGDFSKIWRHFGNSLCLGHTHYPQSQPYFNIEKMILGSPLADVVQGIRERIADSLFGIEPTLNVVKTQMFNSGTTGWFEGVIWAIEIGTTGQARLVYWTRDTDPTKPQTMGWELQPWDEKKRERLQSKIEWLTKSLKNGNIPLGFSRTDFDKLFEDVMSLPAEVLVTFGKEIGTGIEAVLSDLDRSFLDSHSIDEFVSEIGSRTQELTELFIRLFLCLFSREMPNPPSGKQTFSIRITVPSDVRARLNTILDTLKLIPSQIIDIDDSYKLRVACIWLLFTEGIPTIGGSINKVFGLTNSMTTSHPVLFSVLSVIPMLAPSVEISIGNQGAKISSDVCLNSNELVITITVK